MFSDVKPLEEKPVLPGSQHLWRTDPDYLAFTSKEKVQFYSDEDDQHRHDEQPAKRVCQFHPQQRPTEYTSYSPDFSTGINKMVYIQLCTISYFSCVHCTLSL